MEIILIWAMDSKGGIGYKGRLPWHYPEDLSHFKSTTLGYPVLMGRKTFDSLPSGPLPGRMNLVLSHRELSLYSERDNVRRLASLPEVLSLGEEKKWQKLFVIGGEEVYRHFLPAADTLIVTRIGKSFECDRYFPPLEWDKWDMVSSRSSGDLTFQHYRRRIRTR